MISIKEKTDCCGCSACYSVCHRKAIQMISDHEGFLYPEINTELCSKCGLCEKVCPVINKTSEKKTVRKAFIVQNKDKQILKESTSGGAFTAIADFVIDQGGVVFGAAFDEHFHVGHTYAETKQELARFRNSKYVQSDIGETFIQVKNFLKDNRLVCFSGTPCQIEGLKRFLMKENDHLITVDVVCRAVPSPGVWKKYFDYLNHHDKIKSVRFRDKTLGYQFSTMEVRTCSNKVYRGGIESQKWLRMFFSGMIIRPSCTDCRFRSPDRVSDMTIWDCFNIYKIDRTFNEDAGTTRMIVHTRNGMEVLNSIQKKLKCKEIDYDLAIRHVKEMKESPEENVKKNDFFKDFNTLPMEQLLKRYFPDTCKTRFKRKMRIILHKLNLDKPLKHILNKG